MAIIKNLKKGDVVKHENKFLLVKAQKECEGCVFDIPGSDLCNKPNDFYSCYLNTKTDDTIIFKEISEIEALVLQGDNYEDS